jgi:hypothetical protein
VTERHSAVFYDQLNGLSSLRGTSEFKVGVVCFLKERKQSVSRDPTWLRLLKLGTEKNCESPVAINRPTRYVRKANPVDLHALVFGLTDEVLNSSTVRYTPWDPFYERLQASSL